MKIPPYEASGIEGCFNISPSSLATFIDNPENWYKSHVTRESRFAGNLNSVFGNIIHSGIEQFFNGEKLTTEDVQDYLDSYPDVDQWFILEWWEDSLKRAIEALEPLGCPDKQEVSINHKVADGYSIGGKYDYRRGTTLGDYKTTSTAKSSIDSHKWQLMELAYIDRVHGVQTTHLEVVYITRPVDAVEATEISPKTGKLIGGKKEKPTTVKIVTYEIQDEDWITIEKKLKLVVRTMRVYREQPELADVLFRPNEISYRQN